MKKTFCLKRIEDDKKQMLKETVNKMKATQRNLPFIYFRFLAI